MRRKLSVILLATMLVLTAFAPAVSAQESTETAEITLNVDVTQDPGTGNATVTVTNESGDAVEGATVNVSSDAYAGDGEYTTESDGTIGEELPNPSEELDIVVNVTKSDSTASETFTLVPVEDSLSATITQNADGTAFVEVTQYGDAVEGATVNVSSDVAYSGNGSYTTDADGMVDLDEPETTVNVTANVSSGDLNTTAEAELSPIDFYVDAVQNDDGNATVTVGDDNGTIENATVEVTANDAIAYEGTGTYNTSADGTVELPAPEQNVTLTITATNGSDMATTTLELTVAGAEEPENGGYANFGTWITTYIDQLRTEGYFGAEFGQAVSDFATENNPGADNKPDHAGKPDDASNAAASDEDKRGPPEHAQNKKGDAEEADNEEDCEDDSSDESCEVESEEDTEDDDKERGNSGDKGKSGNNGNGKDRGK